METVADKFKEIFQHWDIQLPIEDVKLRQRGSISSAGWEIWYLFGTDIEGDYLDYYATHRMTNDRHERIHSDGTCRALPCMGQFCMLSDDPEESERLQNEFDERNQQVSDMLNAKGFRNL